MLPYINLGSYVLSSYYLFILIGLFFALLVAIIRSCNKNFSIVPNDIYYAFLSIFLGATIGAKIFQLIGVFIRDGASPDFWTIKNLLSLLNGAGVFYGGLLGGTISLCIYTHIKKFDFSEVFDVLIPSALTFNIFGRIGCYCAGCCYGIEYNSRLFSYINSPYGTALVPVQLFESLFNLAMLIMILIIKPERKYKGILFPIYIICYSLGRFILEFFRGDINRGIYILSVSQWISLLFLPTGIMLLVKVLKKPKTKWKNR